MWPKWSRVINYYKECVSEAPTVPFIIGALREPVGGESETGDCFDELVSLMSDVIEHAPEGYVLQLRRCRGLGEPVIEAFAEAEATNGIYHIGGQEIRSNSQDRVTALVFDEFLAEGYDAEAIASVLNEELSGYIDAGRFSFRNGTYQPFHTKDRKVISEALGK